MGKQTGRGRTWRAFVQSQMPQDLSNDLRLLDEGDHLPGAPTASAAERIHLVDFLQQAGPIATPLPGKKLTRGLWLRRAVALVLRQGRECLFAPSDEKKMGARGRPRSRVIFRVSLSC